MADLLLVVTLAGKRIALPASKVEAVVELEGVTPAPCAATHVAGLSSLRSRVLTVIDGLAALDFGRAEPAVLTNAIIIPFGGHPYALLVDGVEDVVEASAAPLAVGAPLGSGWDRVATGMVEADSELLLCVDPHLLIAGPASQAA